MRCLALAQGVECAGGKAIFICRELPGHLCDEIAARGFTVLRLPTDTAGASQDLGDGPPHKSRLGTTWQNDAQQTHPSQEKN